MAPQTKEEKEEGEEDFDLSSGDEAGLLALADNASKRKASDDLVQPPNRIRYQSALNVLTKHFGMNKFRLKQEQVISRILGGESAAVIFPTGGGKSLCYQVPALAFAEEDGLAGVREDGHGITLVVSPLIALMKDQVDALVRRGIKAASLDSSRSREEYTTTCGLLRRGELKILYCAPERLNNEGFIEQMRYVRGGVRLLAVDEAHCISEWGHAFRPDYLKVSRFANEIKAERVVCLTATATPRVASDICKAFNIDESAGLFRTSTYRENLQLLAESGKTKKDLYPKLFKFLKNNPGPSIVYVTIQKQTEHLAMELRREGFIAKSFHAGMDSAAKMALQNEFMRRDDLIIVATIAFGMGIDKANIRNVVHYNLPSSLESYSQEIGRAGRDGMNSKCMFYVCGEDLHLRELFARGDLPSRESIRRLLEEIFDPKNTALPVDGELKFAHYAQEREYDIRSTALKNVYAQLELSYDLIRATTPLYTQYQYEAGPSYDSTIARDKSPAAIAVKEFAKRAKKYHNIDIDAAANKYRLDRKIIIRKLNDWDSTGAVELKPKGVVNVYKILKKLPKKTEDIEKLVDEIYSIMQQREQDALRRSNDMLQLITAEACFSKSLAIHFGDDLPGGKMECGRCTWCSTHKAIVQQAPPPVQFNQNAMEAILQQVPDRDDPRLLAKIAFGISSPRVTALKLSKDPIFGSMWDHDFMKLLASFTSACTSAKKNS
ncbi:unnamed protein product [Diplocarpon coronariae]|uniref:ATP-dependent DNA helicase n=1 Tax=Diplocarpon coronariae TaxID=2795749 RepID=A0A218YZT0_9HELO|nr:recQ family ATP-dependent DNA helicase [Diplocarpon mali]OWP01327.1 ATP-dependent DNA helicase recQ [Marssonina coronariae]